MEILIADIGDIEELARVEVESKVRSFKHNDDYAIDYDSRVKRWQTYFNGQSPANSKPERIVLKAVEDGQIIGYIAAHLTNRYDRDAEIQSFYILKDRQRKGVGSKLLLKLQDWLTAQNAGSLCVGISPENPYKAFYLKYGGGYINPHWICWDDLGKLETKLKIVDSK